MKTYATIDGNEAVASVAHRINEVVAIYPITPASPMGEWADQWSAEGRKNIWGTVPLVVEMQSEGGAAGAAHGALQAGALTTTFTAAQGLLLKIPNMYKIAGELSPIVIHVAARTLATHALSIFGDHSDVMAARATGFGMMASGSVQETTDFALISQTAAMESRIPFVHFFDGFRTSHEVSKIQMLSDDLLGQFITDDLIAEHRARALTPDRPRIRGTAQNPDVFFQARERVNPFYEACPGIVQSVMDRFAKATGRAYHLFDFVGARDADRVIILMGSGAEATHEAVDHLVRKGEKVGVIKVRLFRPFDAAALVAAVPATAKSIAVLDRTKEPGAGEPLYLDCVNAFHEAALAGDGAARPMPRIIGGRYGLSSKEFTPAQVIGIFDHLRERKLKNHFTIGIEDDVSHTSLPFDAEISTESAKTFRAMFYGLGADGTVGANKNTIKIIGEGTENYAQGYFVYDSKKAGAVTVSHLRFGPEPIRSTYLITRANFVACHQEVFLDRYDMLQYLVPGGVFLLNSTLKPEEVWDRLPREVQEQLIAKKAEFHVIDAYAVARELGMKTRINTVMQTCFFAISKVLPQAQAMEAIRKAIRDTYGKKGPEIVNQNLRAVDVAIQSMHAIEVPDRVSATRSRPPTVRADAPAPVHEIVAPIMAGRGDDLPVSVMPVDGTFPSGTAAWEKRNIALEIPVWDPEVCIQCGKCAMVCPHGVIRIKVYEPSLLDKRPQAFLAADARDREFENLKYTIQVAPEDCTGCAVCVDVCPAKNKRETRLRAINMQSVPPIREREKTNWEFFLSIPDFDRRNLKANIRQQQIQRPLFEFSGACAGCGETPYVKLLSQLFGDRALIANATGCSSIYGGNLPTTPWTVNHEGRGPAWSNSLFEDNAEFGLGFRLAIDQQRNIASQLLRGLAGQVGDSLVEEILAAQQTDEAGIFEQRERVAALKAKLARVDSSQARRLLDVADALVKKSVWIVGGDGWAYDIGFGGLDHVLLSGHDVNVLVLDTEVYSNTGGQCSKSTPLGAVAKFAAGGKPVGKKDLGMIAVSYGNVYVATVAMGARDEHTLRAFMEAEAYPGPSLIIAYSHCIAHGIDMTTGLQNQKMAVQCGQWVLYRHNPALEAAGKNPFQLDSKEPKTPVSEYFQMENRFRMLRQTKPEAAREFMRRAQELAQARWEQASYLAAREFEDGKGSRPAAEAEKPKA